MPIQNPTWSGLQNDSKRAWACETNNNKEKIIAQFVANSKSSGPVTKNHNLRTVYKMEFEDRNGGEYYSACTANSEGPFQFGVNSVMFDTTADDNSNEESVVEGSDLNVSAVVAKKERPSILKGNRRKTFKSSEMPAGAVGKMMASKQMKLMDSGLFDLFWEYGKHRLLWM